MTRFFQQPPAFYCGVDLHARTMYLRILITPEQFGRMATGRIVEEHFRTISVATPRLKKRPGRPGDYSPGSHRSGRALLRHPARPVLDSLPALLSVSVTWTRDRGTVPSSGFPLTGPGRTAPVATNLANWQTTPPGSKDLAPSAQRVGGRTMANGGQKMHRPPRVSNWQN
jgi:hypothetical protein